MDHTTQSRSRDSQGWEAPQLPAIAGGRPARAQFIKPSVALDEAARADILHLISGAELSAWRGGPRCREFERAFALWHGYADSVAVNSGTSALHCAYLAAGVRAGDEVIVPAACYVSAVSAAVQAGATPVVCDIDTDTLSLDPVQLERCISRHTSLIVPVHLWGIPSDMAVISTIADRHGLRVVEDCAQAFGARSESRPVGTFSVAAAFSFAAVKLISTGHGGAVLCSDAEIAERVRRLANKGKGSGWHDYVELGYSYAMPEFEAIVGMSGLRQAEHLIRMRARAAEIYRETLADTDLRWPEVRVDAAPSFYKFPVILPPHSRPARDVILRALALEGVSARLTHPSLLSIPWVASASRVGCRTPVADQTLPFVLELETGPNMTEDDVRTSALAVRRVYHYVRTSAPQ